MPFNRAWLILPSKRVQQQKQIQKLQINIKFISIKSRFKRQSNKKVKEEKRC